MEHHSNNLIHHLKDKQLNTTMILKILLLKINKVFRQKNLMHNRQLLKKGMRKCIKRILTQLYKFITKKPAPLEKQLMFQED